MIAFKVLTFDVLKNTCMPRLLFSSWRLCIIRGFPFSVKLYYVTMDGNKILTVPFNATK